MTKNTMVLTLCTLGAFVLTATAVPVSKSAAQGFSATTVELSAAEDKDKKRIGNKKVAPKVQRAPVRTVPRTTTIQRAPVRTAPRTTTIHRAPPKLNTTQQKTRVNVGTKKIVGPKVVGPKVVGPKVIGAKVGGAKTVKVFVPKGAKSKQVVFKGKLRSFPKAGVGHAVIGGRNFSVWRGRHRVRHRNGWYTFVGLGALTAIAIGANHYYPYAYISAPEDYCDGLTEDGCQMVWQEVETIEGDLIPQCVAYCPWQ